MNNKDRDVLKKWLCSRCKYSEGVFKDPGYSSFYTSFFSHFFDDDTYIDKDIDHEINIGYCAPDDYDDEYCDEDVNVRPYVDFVSTDGNIQKGILIPPGSNHSNANYIYKRLMIGVRHIDEFRIPRVGNKTSEFRSLYKNEKIVFDKEDVYKFVHSVSTINHSKQKLYDIINIIALEPKPGTADPFDDNSEVRAQYYDEPDECNEENECNRVADDVKCIDVKYKSNIYTSVDNFFTQRQNTQHKNKNKSDSISTTTNKGSNILKPDIHITSELNRIEKAIANLQSDMMRYRNCVKDIWEVIITPFIMSDDCLTFDYMSNTDYWIFEKFMETRPIYRVMTASLTRIKDRERYLLR
jgi:hypothetical protein